MLRVAKAAAAAVLVLGASAVNATNWLFVRESPLQYFDAADLKQVRGTALEMLDRGNEGETSAWRNPVTGNSGEVKLLGTRKGGDAACRELQLKVRARNGLADQVNVNLCKGRSGWALTAP